MTKVFLSQLVAACDTIVARIDLEASGEKLRQAWRDEHREECLRRLQERQQETRTLECKSGIVKAIPRYSNGSASSSKQDDSGAIARLKEHKEVVCVAVW